jgi:hypothetical protein
LPNGSIFQASVVLYYTCDMGSETAPHLIWLPRVSHACVCVHVHTCGWVCIVPYDFVKCVSITTIKIQNTSIPQRSLL